MSVIWESLVRSGLFIHVGSWVVLQYFGGRARLVSQYFGKSALRYVSRLGSSVGSVGQYIGKALLL